MEQLSAASPEPDVKTSLHEAAAYERRQLTRRRGFVMAFQGAVFSGIIFGDLDNLLGRDIDVPLWVPFGLVWFSAMAMIYLRTRDAWQPVFRNPPPPSLQQAVSFFAVIAAGIVLLLLLAYFFGYADRTLALLGSVMAAAMTGFLFATGHQQQDKAARGYAIVSIAWPLLIAAGILPHEFIFTWIAIGYAIPLFLLGVFRVVGSPE